MKMGVEMAACSDKVIKRLAYFDRVFYKVFITRKAT
jgi:hypothetical protein